MKLSLLIAVVAASLIGCASPTPASKQPGPPSKVEAAQVLKNKTVALVAKDEDGDQRAYCTGVWVSDTKILSARHCTGDDFFGLKPVGSFVTYAVASDVFDGGNPVPREVIVPRISTLCASDDEHDLVLLCTSKPPSGHGIASVTQEPVIPGQFAQEIGQSLGLWWSYSSGDVAAIRHYDTGDGPMLWVQTTTPSSPGNSGGGLFDENTNLIGICHGSFTRGQLVNIFVHPSYINRFLKANAT
jgi:hypothetical protein